MSDTDRPPPVITPKALSDALAALGVYAEAPNEAQLGEAERVEGRQGLTVRLANALYGLALAHVMTAEVAAADARVEVGYRGEAWRATGADAAGIAALLHYTATRLASELGAISDRLTVDLGVMSAASRAAEALKLLLEVSTVHTLADPRATQVGTNLARAGDQLTAAVEDLDALFATAADVASIIAAR